MGPDNRPPAGGLGAPLPAYGNAWQPPTPPPSRFTVATIARIIVLVVGLPALGAIVYAIVTFEMEKGRDLVVFDNRLDSPAEVIVDGKTIETLKPRSAFWIHPVVKLPDGAKKIEVRSQGALVSEATLDIRPRAKDEKNGYRALYVVGPTREYVIAKMPYAADETALERPTLQRLGRPSPLLPLPRELQSFEISNIDGPFLASEKVPSGSKVVWKTRLCTIDTEKDPVVVGCSGFVRH
jgi:hypothetical protein